MDKAACLESWLGPVMSIEPFSDKLREDMEAQMKAFRTDIQTYFRSVRVRCSSLPKSVHRQGDGTVRNAPRSRSKVSSLVDFNDTESAMLGLRSELSVAAAFSLCGATQNKTQEAVGLKTSMPKEFTSGAHAVFLLGRMCDHISVFGTTSWGNPNDGGYQMAEGRQTIRASGARYHDWVLERFAWRMLHAAGRVTVCSMSEHQSTAGEQGANQTDADQTPPDSADADVAADAEGNDSADADAATPL